MRFSQTYHAWLHNHVYQQAPIPAYPAELTLFDELWLEVVFIPSIGMSLFLQFYF
jgi:hypothetical protein